jgi:tetratricopeptide (TPR) repeat protein
MRSKPSPKPSSWTRRVRMFFCFCPRTIFGGEKSNGVLTPIWEYLKINPLDEDTWGEAGKIAAWTGRFLQSIEIYQEGLEVFPDSLTLRVNLGLTHLWNNQTDLGEQSFTAALRAAEADPEKILELGDVFRINGVPERSIAVYRRGQQIHPEFLNFYLRLQETLLSLDRQEESQAVSESIQRVFNPSPELSTFIEEFNNKLRLQEEVLSVYEQQLAENPDNIRLRELVVQAYFWNGKRSLAIDQYQDVIINAMYQSFNAFDQEQRPVLELLDRLYLLRGFLIQAQNARLVQTDLQRTLQELDQALADLRDMPTAESQGIEAQSSRIDSLQEDLAQQEAQLRLWVDIIEEAAAQQEKLEVIRSAIIDQDDQDKLRFESLTEATGWQWDPSLTRGELQKVRIRGNPLAESILGTLEKINENFELVGPLVTGEGHQTLALSSRTDSQAAFWKSGGESLPESFGVHGTHGPSLDTLAASLNPSLDSPAVYSALTPENSQEVLARMSQELPQLSSRLTAIDREIRLAHEILRRKLGLHFYIFDVNNKLRRFQLGSYLMTEGRHEEALDQFNNVIAVDPWNISARYNKGVLQELSRDWKGAMNTYREVYNNDPNFENVITRHNALARLHPDRTFVQISTTSDNNRVTQSAQGSILMQPSSFLSLTTHLLMSDVRFVNPSDIENPGNYAYTDTYLNVDAYLPFLDWIKYRAAGGLTVNQKLQMAETGDSIMLGQYFDSLEIHPFFAAGVTLELGGFNLTVDANREVVRDSLFDSRTRAFNHEATLAGNWFVSVPGSSSINFFNGRVYTSLGRIENEGTDFGNNQIGGGVDLGASFRLLADPLTNLEIRGVVDFQNGQAPWVNNYYSPDQVLLSKLQATYSSWINLGGENILAAIFQLNGGLYQDNILEKSAQNYVLLSGLGKLELTQGGANYFLFSDLNWTFQDITAPTYWTFTIGLGGNFSLSNFLLP